MNAFENWFCSTALWRYITRKQLLPWLLSDAILGERLLEIGAGAGAATAELRKRAQNVISLELDGQFAAKLLKIGSNSLVVQGDATSLPFIEGVFSSAVAVLVLHHLPSTELQDRAFAEIYRVLRPGGCFFAVEIQDRWLQRVTHWKSTFVPVQPTSVSVRLTRAGFSNVQIGMQGAGFRLQAHKASA